MRQRYMADPVRYRRMTTEELRETFVACDLFQPGRIDMIYLDLDRTVVGSAVPLDVPLPLPCDDLLKAAYFTERRELGVLNVGGAGRVTVGDREFTLGNLDALYVGRGNERVLFASEDVDSPAEYYLLSYPAHAEYPSQLIASAALPKIELGSVETANRRSITQLIHARGVKSCQLVMGFTQLATGSVWNTIPPHTHTRRSEVYFYFNLAESERIIHLMGPAKETRSLILADKQVVISPGWSIHAAAGTASYTFCWGMGGENQDYDDMDRLAIADLQ